LADSASGRSRSRLGTLLRAHRILARVVFYSLAIGVGLPMAFCHVQTRPVRQETHPPPAGVEELTLPCEGLRLRAWLLRGDPELPAAVLVHGVGDTLESYLDVAQVLRRRGHTVLLPDLRGHGGSEGSITTLGAREREDVRAAMTQVAGLGLAQRGFVLMGWSMGAVAVLRAAADRNDVRAVIVEAPYDTYRNTVAHHAWLLYRLPRWVPLIPISVAFAGWRGGFDPDKVDAVAAARRLRAPLLVIVDGADARMPEPVARRVFDAHPGPKSFWVAPGADHVAARLRSDYWPHVLEFLESYAR
jgi:pimeloyl-ACP methyl ester carboxylesterase